MTRRNELRCYDYVNRPHDQVSDALAADARKIFERATRSAAARAQDLGAELRARIGAVEVSADVEIQILGVTEAQAPDGKPATRIDLTWRSRRSPGLFPELTGALSAYALTPQETQIELAGTYDPPLGLFGQAIDALAMHRIAEASVQRFVSDVAAFLRAELPALPGPGDTFVLGDRQS